jgi:DNA-binding MarR family transcriptional regulator
VTVEITEAGVAQGSRNILKGSVFEAAAQAMADDERARITDSLFRLREHLDRVTGAPDPPRRGRLPPDPGEDERVRDLLRAYNDTLVVAEPVLLEIWHSSDLTFTQLRILRWLRRHGAMSAGALSALAATPAASLTRMLARLEEAGLLVRRFDGADRRRILIEMTEAGIHAIGRSVLLGTVFEEATRAMDPGERQRMAEDLYTLSARLFEAEARSGAAAPQAQEGPT